jgi:hypothetical protein
VAADISPIIKLLSTVQTAGQARAASGAALDAVHDCYDLLSQLSADRARAGKTELDDARTQLQQWYKKIEKVSAAAPFANEWSTHRKLVERCYIAIAGVEGTAQHVPQTSNLQILGQSIAEAPALFVAQVGKAAGSVAKEAGAVVGSAAGGIFSGLGLSGTVTLLLIAAGVVLFLKRGTLIGRLLG